MSRREPARQGEFTGRPDGSADTTPTAVAAAISTRPAHHDDPRREPSRPIASRRRTIHVQGPPGVRNSQTGAGQPRIAIGTRMTKKPGSRPRHPQPAIHRQQRDADGERQPRAGRALGGEVVGPAHGEGDQPTANRRTRRPRGARPLPLRWRHSPRHPWRDVTAGDRLRTDPARVGGRRRRCRSAPRSRTGASSSTPRAAR